MSDLYRDTNKAEVEEQFLAEKIKNIEKRVDYRTNKNFSELK